MAPPRRRGRLREERGQLFAPALGVLAVAMLVPLVLAMVQGDERSARAFLYAGLFTAFAAGILGVALQGRAASVGPQMELATLLAGWLAIPVFAAIPLVLLTPSIGWLGAWFEMVAAFTTTGSTIYLDPARVPDPVHLWRGIVAWLGGLVTLLAAYAILAPRRLGGFEVRTHSGDDNDAAAGPVRLAELTARTPGIDERLRRAIRAILPVYASLTLAFFLLSGALAELDLDLAVHVLGTVSTSGISAGAPGAPAFPNVGVEMLATVFLVLAATARLYGNASPVGRTVRLSRDPELRLLALIVAAATLALFLRHWLGALSQVGGESGIDAIEAFWGIAFTTLSFLTTTGYEAASWESARAWAGLSNPTLMLLALAAIGGGAATTAGGIKLIRAAALIRHGLREIDRLAQPNVVGGSGTGVSAGMRGVVGEGAFLGWAFIMLFAGAVCVVVLGLAVSGLAFEPALVAAISAISNTGPVFGMVAPGHESYALLDGPQRVWLALGMVLGRMETLAVVALFRRDALLSLLPQRKRGGKEQGRAPHS
ncbi:MAG: potassium transporter TrkG [Pseudomonadota bacterium]